MSYLLVVNANAGSAERETVEVCERLLSDSGACDVVETESADHVDEVLRSLDERQLVVLGGDGSVHLAVERIRAAELLEEVPVGWIPLGTGNDLARTLGLPLDPDEATEVVARGRTRRLDLVVADDGTLCVNALHAGIGVDAAARAQALKERVGEFAYPLGALAAGVTADGWDLTVELDGQVVAPPAPDQEGDARNTLLVAVMNGRTFGGGTEMSPTAEPDDGELDVIVCHALAPARRAAFGVALRGGRHLERDDVAFARGREVRISGDPVGYNVDGELDDEEHTERHFSVEPRVWSVIVPG